MNPLPLPNTLHSQMVTTRNQEIINLQAETKYNKETIQKMTSQIASISSKVENLTNQVKGEFDSINGQLDYFQSTLNKLLYKS
jgi:peptidoglycan hydrolase CwlO-like protein